MENGDNTYFYLFFLDKKNKVKYILLE